MKPKRLIDLAPGRSNYDTFKEAPPLSSVIVVEGADRVIYAIPQPIRFGGGGGG